MNNCKQLSLAGTMFFATPESKVKETKLNSGGKYKNTDNYTHTLLKKKGAFSLVSSTHTHTVKRRRAAQQHGYL